MLAAGMRVETLAGQVNVLDCTESCAVYLLNAPSSALLVWAAPHVICYRPGLGFPSISKRGQSLSRVRSAGKSTTDAAPMLHVLLTYANHND